MAVGPRRIDRFDRHFAIHVKAPLILSEHFAKQADGGLIVNMIDHGMSPQQAVEAPRIWTEGAHVELEPDYAHHKAALEAKGHEVKLVPHIGGGMNLIAFEEGGAMTGAACWRADGTVSAMGGGLAASGISFHI